MLHPHIVGFGRVLEDVVQLALGTARLGRDRHRLAESARAQAQLQFPLALPDGEHAFRRMMHDRLANRLPLLALQSGKKVETVFSGVFGKLHTGDLRGCRHQIREAAQLIADCARRNLPRPARDKRNAVSGIPDVGLLALPVGVGAMREPLLVFRLPVGSVVAGENHQRVVRQPGLVQCAEHPPQCVVHLRHEIAVDSRFGFALEFRLGNPGRVWRRQCQIQEEGLGRLGRELLDQPDRPVGERWQDILDMEVRSDPAASPEHSARRILAVGVRRRLLHRMIVLDVEIRIHVERGGNTEVVVETVIDGSGPQRLIVIGLLLASQAEVPLADPGRVIAAAL